MFLNWFAVFRQSETDCATSIPRPSRAFSFKHIIRKSGNRFSEKVMRQVKSYRPRKGMTMDFLRRAKPLHTRSAFAESIRDRTWNKRAFTVFRNDAGRSERRIQFGEGFNGSQTLPRVLRLSRRYRPKPAAIFRALYRSTESARYAGRRRTRRGNTRFARRGHWPLRNIFVKSEPPRQAPGVRSRVFHQVHQVIVTSTPGTLVD